MSKITDLPQNIQEILKLADENEAFKKKMDECKTKEDAVQVAKAHSIEVSVADLEQLLQSKENLELSDEDLEKVAGGYYDPNGNAGGGW